SSCYNANRRYYEKNRERILQLRRASRIEARARLEYLERIQISCFQTHCPPQLPSIYDLLNFEYSQHEKMLASRPEEKLR
ncbi:3655_t:CDS:1, partial [Racocetra persica]